MLVVYVSFQANCSGTLYTVYDKDGVSFEGWEELASCIDRLCGALDDNVEQNVGEPLHPGAAEQEIWRRCARSRTIVLRVFRCSDNGPQGCAHLTKGKISFDGLRELVAMLEAENTGGF